MSELSFSLSALQEWLVTITSLTDEVKNGSSLLERYNLLKSTVTDQQVVKRLVFPFSLFNHLLAMLRHKTSDNKLIPIAVREYATGN